MRCFGTASVADISCVKIAGILPEGDDNPTGNVLSAMFEYERMERFWGVSAVDPRRYLRPVGDVAVSVAVWTAEPDMNNDDWDTIEESCIFLGVGPLPVTVWQPGTEAYTPAGLSGLAIENSGWHVLRAAIRGFDPDRPNETEFGVQLWPTSEPMFVKRIKHEPRASLRLGRCPGTDVPWCWSHIISARYRSGDHYVTDSDLGHDTRVLDRLPHIERASSSLGLSLPPELKALFAILSMRPSRHWSDIVPMMDFLDIEEAIDQRAMMLDAWRPRDWPRQAGVTAHSYIPAFLPIAERDGYLLVIDLRPGRRRGRIVEFDKVDADDSEHSWDSVKDLLDELAQAVEYRRLFLGWKPGFDTGRLDWSAASGGVEVHREPRHDDDVQEDDGQDSIGGDGSVKDVGSYRDVPDVDPEADDQALDARATGRMPLQRLDWPPLNETPLIAWSTSESSRRAAEEAGAESFHDIYGPGQGASSTVIRDDQRGSSHVGDEQRSTEGHQAVGSQNRLVEIDGLYRVDIAGGWILSANYRTEILSWSGPELGKYGGGIPGTIIQLVDPRTGEHPLGEVTVGLFIEVSEPFLDSDRWDIVQESQIRLDVGSLKVLRTWHAGGEELLPGLSGLNIESPGWHVMRTSVRGFDHNVLNGTELRIQLWPADDFQSVRRIKYRPPVTAGYGRRREDDIGWVWVRMLDALTRAGDSRHEFARIDAVGDEVLARGRRRDLRVGGVVPPEDVHEFFAIVGAKPKRHWSHLLPGLDLLDFVESLAVKSAIMQATGKRYVGERWPSYAFRPEYLPIAERDGDAIVVDLRPGRYEGRILQYDHIEGTSHARTWPSVTEFMDELTTAIEYRRPFLGATPDFERGDLEWI